jgi:hypothetical protein
MSAVAEKIKAVRSTRLERIDAAIAEDEGKLAATEARIAELVAAEDEGVAETKRKDPSANAYQLGSAAQTARSEREKAERSVEGLTKGLFALRAERVLAARQEAARRLAAAIEEGRDLLARERDVRLAAGKAFAELAERWNALADVLEKRSELHSRVRLEQLLETVGSDTEVAARWETVGHYAVEPVPTSFATFVDELLEAAFDQRTDVEAEFLAVDEINARRRAMAATNPGGADDLPPVPRPVIPEEPLHELVPDLRGEVRKADVSGVDTRRLATPEPPWPEPWTQPAA